MDIYNRGGLNCDNYQKFTSRRHDKASKKRHYEGLTKLTKNYDFAEAQVRAICNQVKVLPRKAFYMPI